MARIPGPRLPKNDVDSDEQLADAIYRLLEARADRATESKKIQRAQQRLRRLVDQRAWDAYLVLEELVNERADRQLRVVARWAFVEGARSVTRRRTGRRG